MESPKKPKYRKQMKRLRHLRGTETRGCTLAFGDFGLRVMEDCRITNRQLEAARIAFTRTAKRGGKSWLRVFPDKPLTAKPAETRMGKGKGAPEHWVAVVRPGKIIYELAGVSADVAKKALEKAAAKIPAKCQFVARDNYLLGG